MAVLPRLVAMLALVGLGIIAKRAEVLTPGRTGHLNAVTFYVALPALVFASTFDRRPAELASVELLVGTVVAMVGTVVLAWVVHRNQRTAARRSVAIVQSYHSNLGYIGLPLVTAGLGGLASGQAAVILGIGVLVQTPLTTLLLVRINGANTDVAREVRRLATNPVIVALVAGLAVASVDWAPPTPATEGVRIVSRAALPLALLCVGASLNVTLDAVDLPLVGSVVGLKVFAMPALAFVAFTAIGAAPSTVAAGVIMLGTPAAVSSYIYAGELGGDAKLASVNVLATTLVGVATLSGLLFLFG